MAESPTPVHNDAPVSASRTLAAAPSGLVSATTVTTAEGSHLTPLATSRPGPNPPWETPQVPWSPLPTPDGPEARGPAPLAGGLDAVLAGLGGPTVQAIVVVHERWPEVVGPEVAPHAKPLGITGGRLQIGVDSPGWASHLRWSEADIVARLTALLGPDQVTSVAIRLTRR